MNGPLPPTHKPPSSPLFIAGSGRSGTTLLLDAFRAHPSVFAFGEAKLFDSYDFRIIGEHLLNNKSPEEQGEILSILINNLYCRTITVGGNSPQGEQEEKVGLYNWIDEATMNRHVSDLTGIQQCTTLDEIFKLLGGFFEKVFNAQAELEGCTCWCEKTPTNALHVDVLFSMFPSARLVYTHRDGRDVISSVMRTSWAMDTIENAMNWWIESVAKFFLLAERVDPTNILVISFDELLNDYEFTLREICDFFGVPFAIELLTVKPLKGSTGRWKNEWDQATKQLYIDKCGHVHTSLGYEL